MIITICGTPGSGKSTVAKKLTSQLNYTRLYIGALQRQLAEKKGITLEELQKVEEKDPSLDYEIDDEMKSYVSDNDNVIVESRTAAGLFPKWKIEKDALHVFIKCSVKEGAKRIYNEKKAGGAGRNELSASSLEEQIRYIKERMGSEKKRFKQFYNFDFTDEKLYDIVINVTKMDKDEEYSAVLGAIKKKAKEKYGIAITGI